jgi:hypothetical protein
LITTDKVNESHSMLADQIGPFLAHGMCGEAIDKEWPLCQMWVSLQDLEKTCFPRYRVVDAEVS